MRTTIRPIVMLLIGLGCAALSVSAAPGGQSEPPEELATQAKTQTATDTGQAESEPPGKDQDEAPSEPADDTAAPTGTPARVSADDLLKAFQEDRPTRLPIAPSEGFEEQPVDPDGRRNAGTSHRLPDGFFLVDRAGRVVKDGDWYVFVFESYNESHPELPMKLLPNRLLERMVLESQDAASSTVFIVSGEVTEFMSENYLLLRKLLRRRTLGNLQK